MEGWHLGCFWWNIVLGVLILSSYFFILFLHIGAYIYMVNTDDTIPENPNKKKQQLECSRRRAWLWAGFIEWNPF
jgi:hypothetical protein